MADTRGPAAPSLRLIMGFPPTTDDRPLAVQRGDRRHSLHSHQDIRALVRELTAIWTPWRPRAWDRHNRPGGRSTRCSRPARDTEIVGVTRGRAASRSGGEAQALREVLAKNVVRTRSTLRPLHLGHLALCFAYSLMVRNSSKRCPQALHRYSYVGMRPPPRRQDSWKILAPRSPLSRPLGRHESSGERPGGDNVHGHPRLIEHASARGSPGNGSHRGPFAAVTG